MRLIMRGTGRGARPRPLRMKRVPNLPGNRFLCGMRPGAACSAMPRCALTRLTRQALCAMLNGVRLDPALFLELCRTLAGERAEELLDCLM